MKKNIIYLLVPVILLLTGCAESLSPSTYSRAEVGQANQAVPAKIVSMRSVTIDANSGAGGLVGVAAGATAGSLIGGSDTAHILGGIGGAVAGGVIGNEVEKGIRKTQGTEYVLKTQKGTYVTVTQVQELNLYVGQRVIIIYGKQVRIVPDTTNQ